MANPTGIFDPDLVTAEWFDAGQKVEGWFDDDLVASAPVANSVDGSGWIEAEPYRPMARAAMVAAVALACHSQGFVSYQPDPIIPAPPFGWYVQNPLPSRAPTVARPATLVFQDFGPFVPFGWMAPETRFPARKPALRSANLVPQSFPFVAFGWIPEQRVLPAKPPQQRSAWLTPQDFGPFVPFGWLSPSQPRLQVQTARPAVLSTGFVTLDVPPPAASPNLGWLAAQTYRPAPGLKSTAQDYSWLQAQTTAPPATITLGWYTQPPALSWRINPAWAALQPVGFIPGPISGTITPPVEQGPFFGTPSGGSQSSAMTGGAGATGTTGGGATLGTAQGQLTNTASVSGGPSFKGS